MSGTVLDHTAEMHMLVWVFKVEDSFPLFSLATFSHSIS